MDLRLSNHIDTFHVIPVALCKNAIEFAYLVVQLISKYNLGWVDICPGYPAMLLYHDSVHLSHRHKLKWNVKKWELHSN